MIIQELINFLNLISDKSLQVYVTVPDNNHAGACHSYDISCLTFFAAKTMNDDGQINDEAYIKIIVNN